MTTVPIICPECGVWVRVCVQPSEITVLRNKLEVRFDDQRAAHTCKKRKKEA